MESYANMVEAICDWPQRCSPFVKWEDNGLLNTSLMS